MSIRSADLPFILKISSLLIILLVVNVRNKMNTDFQLANKTELKTYENASNFETQNFVKTSKYKGVGWDNLEVVVINK